MKTLLALVVLLALCIAGLGFYRGWFQLTTDGSNHEADVKISVDRDKIRGDEEGAKKSVHELEQKVKDKAAGAPASSEHRHEQP